MAGKSAQPATNERIVRLLEEVKAQLADAERRGQQIARDAERREQQIARDVARLLERS